MIGFRRSALFDEMFFFAAIVALSFLFWSWAPSLRFFLEASLSLSERRIGFLIYLVGVSLLLSMLEVIVLVLASLFLKSFAEIVVEASGYLD
jgi:hypothetical protein